VQPSYTASFSSLAGRNAIFLLALILMASPVAGFRPTLAARDRTWKMPRSVRRILCGFRLADPAHWGMHMLCRTISRYPARRPAPASSFGSGERCVGTGRMLILRVESATAGRCTVGQAAPALHQLLATPSGATEGDGKSAKVRSNDCSSTENSVARRS
jgi:hypothetical protein